MYFLFDQRSNLSKITHVKDHSCQRSSMSKIIHVKDYPCQNYPCQRLSMSKIIHVKDYPCQRLSMSKIILPCQRLLSDIVIVKVHLWQRSSLSGMILVKDHPVRDHPRQTSYLSDMIHVRYDPCQIEIILVRDHLRRRSYLSENILDTHKPCQRSSLSEIILYSHDTPNHNMCHFKMTTFNIYLNSKFKNHKKIADFAGEYIIFQYSVSKNQHYTQCMSI